MAYLDALLLVGGDRAGQDGVFMDVGEALVRFVVVGHGAVRRPDERRVPERIVGAGYGRLLRAVDRCGDRAEPDEVRIVALRSSVDCQVCKQRRYLFEETVPILLH